jgi:AraC family transcriptional regulator
MSAAPAKRIPARWPSDAPALLAPAPAAEPAADPFPMRGSVISAPAERTREKTVAEHVSAVQRVILLMRARLEEPHTLEELARHAYLSPFHFNRVFRQVTGAPPGRFLTALRIHEAKRLLLATPMSVTDVCMTVGYSSLGTFSTQFKSLVGVAPRQLRQLVLPRAEQPIADALGHSWSDPPSGTGASVMGTIGAVEADYVLVGLFPTAVAQGTPVACTWVDAPGLFRLDDVPCGTYSMLACGFPNTATLFDVILAGPDGGVGIADEPVVVRSRCSIGPVHLRLGRRMETHPPILSALPLLFAVKGPLRDRVGASTLM